MLTYRLVMLLTIAAPAQAAITSGSLGENAAIWIGLIVCALTLQWFFRMVKAGLAILLVALLLWIGTQPWDTRHSNWTSITASLRPYLHTLSSQYAEKKP